MVLTMASAQTTAKPRAFMGSKQLPSHPTYLQMITEAITSLKERTGSSQYAIAAYIGSKYQSQLPSNFKKLLAIQLRNVAKSGKLTKIKNSFKLSEELRKPVKPKASSKLVKAKSPVMKLTAKPRAAPGPKKAPNPAKTLAKVAKAPKVSKPKPAVTPKKAEKAPNPAKTLAKVAKVSKVSKPKPAVTPKKAEKAAVPAKKAAPAKALKTLAPAKAVKKVASPKPKKVAPPAKALKRAGSLKPKKAAPAAKKAKK